MAICLSCSSRARQSLTDVSRFPGLIRGSRKAASKFVEQNLLLIPSACLKTNSECFRPSSPQLAQIQHGHSQQMTSETRLMKIGVLSGDHGRLYSNMTNDLERDLKMFQFKGLMAAPVSPMTEEGEINVSIVPEYVRLLLKQNIKGVYICGSTGEGVSLSVAERKLLAESWIEHGKGRLDTIIIQCGTNSLKDCQELVSHAEKIGAHAVACLPPSYYKPQNEDCIVAFLAAVAKMAPRTPFLYYHIPMLTGVEVDMDTFLEKACSAIPNFHGIKCTTLSLYDFSRCLNFPKRKLCCLYGGDGQLLGALAMGGEAAIGSTYNYVGKANNQMLNAISTGDVKTAQQLQANIQEVIKIQLKYGGKLLGGHNAVNKSILQLCGLDVGPPRLPIIPLSEDQKKELQKDLSAIGFFEWV